ncbi:MFS transporter [Streptomyces sp. GbtcB7]|uniref:MFS transporter n=1 Tax=Streptomyces sp. GbtcB7 TaxID=2824752 RepID=UPI001C301350|nr:MFS transporter [Streptomyces sp. GbtcB7]
MSQPITSPPTDADTTTGDGRGTPESGSWLWRRRLDEYPATGRRFVYLAIVVAVTVLFYYQLNVQYAVSASIISHYGMSFHYFLWVSVAGAVVGALGSLAAGVADRWGRANLVVGGVLAASLLVFFALPNAPDKTSYLVVFAVLSAVEGMTLVATPALIRDFSPQLGRGTAMAFWGAGPIVGTLVATQVVSHTLQGSTTWQDELRYAGVAGLVVFLVALIGLRELSPGLRDQVMVSLHDRELVEARALGIDPQPKGRGQWRQLLRLDIVGTAFSVAFFSLLYLSVVGNFVLYLSTTLGYSEQRANSLLNWFWISNLCGALVGGLLSDRLRVRKPFMLAGAIGSIAVTIVFTLVTRGAETSYDTFVWLLVAMGALNSLTFTPWLAGFTETVERRNPAATAAGLAVFGGALRLVAAGAAALLPVLATAVTPLVEHGAEVQAAARQTAPAQAIIKAHPQVFAELAKYGPGAVPPALSLRAVTEVGVKDLTVVQKAQPELLILKEHGPAVQKASEDVAGQWTSWWWVCVGGQVIFLPFVFVMAGRWRPRKAREDFEAHERTVARELAALSGSGV